MFLAHTNVDYKRLMKENQAKYNNRLKKATSDKDKKRVGLERLKRSKDGLRHILSSVYSRISP